MNLVLAQIELTGVFAGGGVLPVILYYTYKYWIEPLIEAKNQLERRCAELDHDLWRERRRGSQAMSREKEAATPPKDPVEAAAQVIAYAHAQLAHLARSLGTAGATDTVKELRKLLKQFESEFRARSNDPNTKS